MTIPSGNWAANLDNVARAGGANGAGEPTNVGEWVSLAMIRDNGVLTLYIDGVAQSGHAGRCTCH